MKGDDLSLAVNRVALEGKNRFVKLQHLLAGLGAEGWLGAPGSEKLREASKDLRATG